jgi:outer membrane protein OmpA-like peptidoglycan-associated protein
VNWLTRKNKRQSSSRGAFMEKEFKTMQPNGVLVLALCLAGGLLSSAADVDVKGMISTRTGETLVVKTTQGNVTVLLTDSTRTKDNTGLFGLGREEMSNSVLIPGLKVDIDATDQGGRLVASTITVDGDDLETAQMIQAGLHPTAEQVAANMRAIETNRQRIAATQQGVASTQRGVAANQENIAANAQKISASAADIARSRQDISSSQTNIAANKQQIDRNIQDIEETTDRFSRLDDFDIKAQATVKFAVSSSTLSEDDMEVLRLLAQTATGTEGYIIEVKGFADSSGDALMNEKLSEDRAKRVVSFLIQQCNIPIRHVVAPGAIGEYQPVASNETREGRAENRRVEVLVLVNRGIAGK